MDAHVQEAQTWLNDTYGTVSGWVVVAEDGITGWATIYALRRALQNELNVTPLSSGFGPATSAAFVQRIGRIDNTTQSVRLLRILSAALWCKGKAGFWTSTTSLYAQLSNSILEVRASLGLTTTSSFVDVKLMESLLSMDAYSIIQGGNAGVQEVQKWLNATYVGRRDFSIVPTDGVFSRSVQSSLLFGLQYELGMADGTANGNFGPGTRTGLQTQASNLKLGSQDGTTRFVRIFQASMRFNGLACSFSGSFDATTQAKVREFQTFMEIPVTGNGDFTTWSSLLVSSGDSSVSTRGFDTRWQLTSAEASAAVSAGYTVAGRYLLGTGKFVTTQELRGLKAAGLRLLPIHQRSNNQASVMTYANGVTHAIEAAERARVLDLPSGSIIFFCVDFDALGETIEGPVVEYFKGVSDTLSKTTSVKYRCGVYGTRNVCSVILERGYAVGAFVAGMSTGFSGNMGFPMPQNWHYNQIAEIPANFANSRSVYIDKDTVSSKATPVSLTSVRLPPIEQDGSVTATGFDAFFEWVVRAEVAVERGLTEASSITRDVKPYDVFSSDYIAHYLQRPKYWGLNVANGLWNAYTPLLDVTSNESYARAAAEGGLAQLQPATPGTKRDSAHFAATYRGYKTWGVPTTQNDYGLGDLGGWALDLLQLWGNYLRAKTATPSETIAGYFARDFTNQNPVLAFGSDDVVADADAWLLAVAIKDNQAQGLSQAMRGALQESSNRRVYRFYVERFGGSVSNTSAAFRNLVNGIDIGFVENETKLSPTVLKAAARADRLPNPVEAAECGLAFATYMASKQSSA